MKNFYIFLLALLISSCSTQNISLVEKENLKQELTEILRKDQDIRMLMNPKISDEKRNEIMKFHQWDEKDVKENINGIMLKNDSINLAKIEKIIAQYGYPGKSLVGEKLQSTAWLAIQHSDKIEKYFNLIEKAGKKGELKMTNVAMMQDRMLMNRNEEQIYGTQVSGFNVLKNGKKEWIYVVWPIKDPSKVNELRKKAGFSETVEEYIKNFGLVYKNYTLEEIKLMKENGSKGN